MSDPFDVAERGRIIDFLKSDLYRKVPDDGESLLFENPAFRVRITGPRYDPTVEATRLDGTPVFRLEHATVADVDEALP